MMCFLALWGVTNLATGQDTIYTNSVNNMFLGEKNLSIRGYAQIDFNQPITKGVRQNGKLEVHRFVLFTGYRFNDKLQFISEIELEHGDEIFIEQAYAQYKISNGLNLRAGMLVIPMGIINEYHEPTTFHGVERPSVEGKVIPSTWRELALGITGVIPAASIRYQLYVTNGFLSHDGSNGILGGADGLRRGRQKGLRSTISSPNFSTKLDYFGVRNLKLGLAAYLGRTQSALYNGLDKNEPINRAAADSSTIGLFMMAIDARYNRGGLEARGLLVLSHHSDAQQYNQFTGKDLGSQMTGYYIELAYDVLTMSQKKYSTALLPFVRWERYNTHASTQIIESNPAYDQKEITAGISWRHGQSVSFKGDYQWIENGWGIKSGQLNFGVGVWF
jgi:hypothetical protein